MLHSGKRALPLALAAGIAFSASAQAPPSERETIPVWSSRDGLLHERREFAPSPRTEVSPPAIDPRAWRAHTSRLLICEPDFRKGSLDGRAASTGKDFETDGAGRFGR